MIALRVVVFVLWVAVLVLALVAFARTEVEWDPSVAPVIDTRSGRPLPMFAGSPAIHDDG
jgi:hypothetical protein